MFIGSIPALVTPFTDGGESIDYERLRALIKMHIQNKSDGILIAGTTGESPTYTESEFTKVVETSIEASDGLIDVIVNCGTNATKQSKQRAQIAKNLGAKGALVIIPYYNKPIFNGIVQHFQEIAKVGLPIVIYHHPGRTGITLTAKQLVTLHEIPAVVGIKEASSDPKLTTQICALKKDAIVSSGNDDLAIEVIKNGGKGSYTVFGNLEPLKWKKIITLAQDGKFDQAQKSYALVAKTIDAIGLEVNPQGIKCAMSLKGLCENILRLPLIAASTSTQDAIAKAMQT